MPTKPPLHPALKELGVNREGAVDILNFLLHSNQLDGAALKSAHDSVQQQKQQDTKDLPAEKNDPKPDLSQHRTRHIALRFYYDGAEFSGLAQNVGMESDQSIEKHLFAALVKTHMIQSRETCGYSRCGRTDRGVSSAGQVVAMQLKSAIPNDATWDEQGTMPMKDEELPKNSLQKIKLWILPKKKKKKGTDASKRIQKEIAEYPYDKILNNVLPTTIRILGWCPVSEEFSARFSATTRTYRYFFCKRSLDLVKMKQALELMVGNHDFRNFCKMDVEKVYNFERKIHSVDLIEEDGGKTCYFLILGQAFLWHQIRCIVSVLFMVGRGLEEPSVVSELLNIKKFPGKPSYALAHERPLVLHHCGFTDLQFGYSCQNLWAVACQMEADWEELVLAAARIRSCLESLKEESLHREDILEFARAKLTERWKKQSKHGFISETLVEYTANLQGGLDSDSSVVTWNNALEFLKTRSLIPSPEGLRESMHIPLLRRGCGTTYEEKLDALSRSQKRQQRYEENVVKKRKTKEEDAAFYNHMAKQGGSAM